MMYVMSDECVCAAAVCVLSPVTVSVCVVVCVCVCVWVCDSVCLSFFRARLFEALCYVPKPGLVRSRIDVDF
jgi:hypothetical protein